MEFLEVAFNISDGKSENIGDKLKKSVAYTHKNPGLFPAKIRVFQVLSLYVFKFISKDFCFILCGFLYQVQGLVFVCILCGLFRSYLLLLQCFPDISILFLLVVATETILFDVLFRVAIRLLMEE